MNPKLYNAMVNVIRGITVPFTIEEVKVRLVLRSRATAALVAEESPNNWGPAMLRAKKDGIVVSEGRVVRSKQSMAKGHYLKVWKCSL